MQCVVQYVAHPPKGPKKGETMLRVIWIVVIGSSLVMAAAADAQIVVRRLDHIPRLLPGLGWMNLGQITSEPPYADPPRRGKGTWARKSSRTTKTAVTATRMRFWTAT